MDIVIFLLRQTLPNNDVAEMVVLGTRGRVAHRLTCAHGSCFLFTGIRFSFFSALVARIRMTIIQKHIYDICNSVRCGASRVSRKFGKEQLACVWRGGGRICDWIVSERDMSERNKGGRNCERGMEREIGKRMASNIVAVIVMMAITL